MPVGRVTHVCLSDRRGTVKQPVPVGELRVEHGIVGDAHAGDWHRQLSVLDVRDVDGMRAKGIELAPGAFGENLLIEGVDLGSLGVGSRLQIGAAEIEITQIGKECHQRCAIYGRTGDCIMPRLGVFARVCQGGEVRPGEIVRVAHASPRVAASPER